LRPVLREFRSFILRGNVVDLAVGVVIGTAFTAVVNALVSGLFTPLIAALIGESDFSSLSFEINGSEFLYGTFINALITFLLVAAVLFFLVVKPVNAVMDRFKPDPPPDAETRDCSECLSAIPVAARRCAFCTSEQAPSA
jgi:large conductance mechanosensitive channel